MTNKTLKQIKEESRKAIIMAVHAEAESYEEALNKELGFGCRIKVNENEVVALVGNNGAGKTTLLNTVLGLMHPSSGTIEFMGQLILAESTLHSSRIPSKDLESRG